MVSRVPNRLALCAILAERNADNERSAPANCSSISKETGHEVADHDDHAYGRKGRRWRWAPPHAAIVAALPSRRRCQRFWYIGLAQEHDRNLRRDAPQLCRTGGAAAALCLGRGQSWRWSGSMSTGGSVVDPYLSAFRSGRDHPIGQPACPLPNPAPALSRNQLITRNYGYSPFQTEPNHRGQTHRPHHLFDRTSSTTTSVR